MVKRHEVTKILVEHVKTGMSLSVLCNDNLPPRVFQVEELAWRHAPAEGPPVFTLTSEALAETGEPWVLTYPMGTVVTRIDRTYDDGT